MVGGGISAVTASLLTTGMGYAFYNAVRSAQGKDVKNINAKDLGEAFKEELKKVKF